MTRPKNRLAHETSPYLLQHDENPVDWYPWGDEAFARAKALDRPVLLSVGYSACHWCHVMAHESFEDERIAGLMNEHFVSVKVDREERPDVDQLYQGVVQLMGRGGGWPLTVVLTPERKPFFGGTYFPKEDRYGMPSFPRVLLSLSQVWRERRADALAQADELARGLGQLSTFGLDAPGGTFAPADVAQAAEELEGEVDRVHGGFGVRGPKFPNPMNVALLLRGHRRGGPPALLDAALLTLEKMATTGLYDHLGGGFHRYCVDEAWRVPHFEKMLYDNAQLLHLYAEAQQLAPRPLWRRVAEETVEWLRREMTSPEGGFYAAQDADSEGEEGRFFVWTPPEVEAALPADQARAFSLRFGVTPQGNFEHGQTVLNVAQPVEAVARALGRDEAQVEQDLASARAALFAVRSRRVPPGRDDKVLAGWNGLMVRGLAFAARVFERPDWLALARGAADFLLEKMVRPDGGLHRSFTRGQARLDGVLEDYGGVAAGLTALYQATFEARTLEAALALVEQAQARFFDADRGAWLSAERGTRDLVVPQYALHDGAVPSGASLLAEAQVALAALTGREELLARAAQTVERLRQPMGQNPFAFGHLWGVADAVLDGAASLAVVGPRDDAAPLLDVARARYLPTLAVAWVPSLQDAPAVLRPALEGRRAEPGGATAWLCERFACRAPMRSRAEVEAALTARPG